MRKMSAYYRQLDEILDTIWAQTSLTNQELAEASGLCLQTVIAIEYRITRFPRFKTVFLLAQAVGIELVAIPSVQRKKKRAS